MSAPDDQRSVPSLQAGMVLKSGEVEAYLDLDAQREEVAAHRKALEERAAEAVDAAQRQGYDETVAQAVARVADYAEVLDGLFETFVTSIEPKLVDMVVSTLDEILGDHDAADLASRLVQAKLGMLQRYQPLTFTVASGMGPMIRHTLTEKDREIACEVIEDPQLKAGRILVETPNGYFDLGVAEQTAVAKRLIAKRIAVSVMQNAKI